MGGQKGRFLAEHAALVLAELGRRDDRLHAGRVGRGALDVHALGAGRGEEQGDEEEDLLHCACGCAGGALGPR